MLQGRDLQLNHLSAACFVLYVQDRRLELVLDLHANVCIPGLWIQGNSFDSVYRFERHIVFPKMLALNCPDFEAENAMYNADVEKEGTCRRYSRGGQLL